MIYPITWLDVFATLPWLALACLPALFLNMYLSKRNREEEKELEAWIERYERNKI